MEIWIPISATNRVLPGSDLESPAEQVLEAFGRLHDDGSIESAREALNVVAARLETEHPDLHRNRRISVGLLTGIDSSLRSGVNGFLGVMLVLSGLMLVTACLNVGNLLLARGEAREVEIATRQALGASQGRLIRQLLTETVLLFALGSVAAALMAVQLNSLLARLIDSLPIPLGFDLALDGRVLGLTALAALITALATGLSPALRAARGSQAQRIRRGRGGARALGVRRAFVVGQVAASLVLLATAGLFLRALERGTQLDPGFPLDGLELATVGLPADRYDIAEARAFFRNFEQELAAMPDLEGVALASTPPLGVTATPMPITVPGVEVPQGQTAHFVDGHVVSSGYFNTVGLRMVVGRAFTPTDNEAGRRVAIVNQRLADRFWPN